MYFANACFWKNREELEELQIGAVRMLAPAIS
jgi:hypothetical protein